MTKYVLCIYYDESTLQYQTSDIETHDEYYSSYEHVACSILWRIDAPNGWKCSDDIDDDLVLAIANEHRKDVAKERMYVLNKDIERLSRRIEDYRRELITLSIKYT